MSKRARLDSSEGKMAEAESKRADPAVVSEEEWLKARTDLLAKEKEFSKMKVGALGGCSPPVCGRASGASPTSCATTCPRPPLASLARLTGSEALLCAGH